MLAKYAAPWWSFYLEPHLLILLHFFSVHPLPPDSIFPFGLLVSFAAGDADELLDAAGVPQGLGVLHVLGDDLMQCAADSCDGVVRHGLPHQAAGIASSRTAAVVVVTAPGQAVHQVPHGVFTWYGGKSEWEGGIM